MTEGRSKSISAVDSSGSQDEHDQRYRFGCRPRSTAPYPPRPAQRGFDTRQYARLLVLRSRLRERLAGRADLGAAA